MLPWHKEKVVYVPITTTDTRPYIEKWQDKDYLRQVSGLSGNSIFKTEVIEALRALRDKADSAKTPEELKLNERWLKMSANTLIPSGVVVTNDGRYYLISKNGKQQ